MIEWLRSIETYLPDATKVGRPSGCPAFVVCGAA